MVCSKTNNKVHLNHRVCNHSNLVNSKVAKKAVHLLPSSNRAAKRAEASVVMRRPLSGKSKHLRIVCDQHFFLRTIFPIIITSISSSCWQSETAFDATEASLLWLLRSAPVAIYQERNPTQFPASSYQFSTYMSIKIILLIQK